MNAYVHYTLTRQWAREAGFSAQQAEEIAQADLNVDRAYRGRMLHNVGYHFRAFGARWNARRWFDRAVVTRDIRLLGAALHCEQDAFAHGYLGTLWHWPGIDLWERRSPRARARIERASRKMLGEYAVRTAETDRRLG
ncbi:MAG: hypothetical protein ACYC6C_12880 [Coriobacteriia bacterium]